MAYKFFQGTFKTDGILDVNNAVTGNSLLVDTGGITVTAGASSVQQLTASAFKVDNTVLDGDILQGLSQLTSSNISASSAQFGTLTVATLSAPNLDLSGYLIVSGNTTLGDGSSDVVTIKGQLTASAGVSASALLVQGNTNLNSAVSVFGTTTLNAQTVIKNALLQVSGNQFQVLSSSGASIFEVDGGGVRAKAVSLQVQDGGGSPKVSLDTAGNISGSGQLQVGGQSTYGGLATFNAGIKNYGTDLRSMNQKIVVRDGGDSSDKAFLDGSGQVSGSGALNIGGAGVIAGNFTVNGVQTTVQQLTASFSTLGAAKVTSLSSSGNVIVAGDLQVNGTTTYVNSTNMTVTDKKLVIATGSANALAADGAGIYVGNDNGIATDQYAALSYDGTGDLWNMTSTNGLDLATAGQVVKFEGTTVLEKTKLFGGAVTGSASGVGLKLAATEKTANYTVVVSDYVVAVDTATASGPVTITLPAAEVGRVYLIKDSGGSASSKNITVQRAGSDTIDGANSVPLQSDYAAVSVVCVAAGKWSLF